MVNRKDTHMRRIVTALMGTITGLVLLFSYHTSTNSASAGAALPSEGTATDDGTAATTSPDATSTTSSGSSSSSSSGSSSSSSESSSGSSSSGTFTGPAVDTQWGVVQVEVTVSSGKITKSVAVQYPQNNGRDVEINNSALPRLEQEVLNQQSGNIDAISGATVTSNGYIQSLQSALDKAHLS
jgi:uncharacterized protein with FMN-binding domain